MIIKKCSMIVFVLGLAFIINGCATSIKSYPVNSDGTNRKNGIPYYMPKPMLMVKQSVEVVRKESLFAVISLNGLEMFLYPIDHNDFDKAVKKLEKILKADPNSLILEEAEAKSIYLTEEIMQTGQHSMTTKKYSVLTSPTTKEAGTDDLNQYIPSDIDKSISIVLVPNFEQQFELVIDPSWFSTLEVGVTLTDGWRLDGLTSKSGENQLVGALKDIATTIIGAQKDIDVAEIGKSQALRLKELELESKEGDEEAMEFIQSSNVKVELKGYIKKTVVEVIKPGIYDITSIITSLTSFSFPTIRSEFIQTIHL